MPEPEIIYKLLREDSDIAYCGNGSADIDPNNVQWITEQLNAGNDWAWCRAHVIARITIDGETFEGHDCVEGCSYKSEADFRECVFVDMQAVARDSLLTALQKAVTRGTIAKRALKAYRVQKANTPSKRLVDREA